VAGRPCLLSVGGVRLELRLLCAGIYLVELQKARGWSTGLISPIVTGHYVLGAHRISSGT
jgi:hypothetical protein